ncbi:MAG: metallophosphoesterase [Ruminococcaceae bacterium]|nr:metallophosphoesterase [Oscillospiraceae bacterium]
MKGKNNMKKIRVFCLLLTLCMFLSLAVGCDFINLLGNDSTDTGTDDTTESESESDSESVGDSESSSTTESNTEETTTEKDTETETDPPADDEYRVLLTSDMHYTSLSSYYGMDRDVRLQYWVNGILDEHKRDPFDLIIILGDMSLDYWGWNGGGSYQRNPSVSDTQKFMEKYVSQLPQDVPTIVLPGNHELYTNEKWKQITGNNRNESFVLGENLFVMPDSFSGAIDPAYVGGGKNDSPYKAVDMTFVQAEIDKHPECKNIFLISHHFDLSKESNEFKNLLKTETRIVGLFSGHTHSNKAKDLGAEYNGLRIAQTGNFASYSDETVANFSWGYRDLQISDQLIKSTYIVPGDCFYIVGSKTYKSTRTFSNIVFY